jgi:NAD-dependent dihydropyrimidine dehydrogenase PreA subunit
MEKPGKGKIAIQFILLIAVVVIFSFISTKIWGGRPETLPEAEALIFKAEMTIAEFGKQNQLPNPVLKKVFGLKTKEDLQKKIDDFNLSQKDISDKINRAAALNAEYESKNWVKIPIKFISWIIFLIIAFRLMRKAQITPGIRKALYFIASMIFGVILGSDPSAMGTVKDAIVLLAAKGAIFPPRMIALTIFLLMVFLANKFICSWGCQVGVLQDLVFRLNRNRKDSKGIFKQVKPPFVVTNTVRILFFGVFTLIAFIWALDSIEFIDPFKVYKPAMVGTIAGIFIGAVLVASLFIYRPWCHLFCPFGLVGWLVEKISIFKIHVNYETCIACESCARACPSTVMNAILKREHVIPDCFACGTCIGVCPTDSIHFLAGRRSRPPADKFKEKEKVEQDSALGQTTYAP